jgi:hypothetical protein
MTGSALFTGAVGSATTAVCAERAFAEPSALVAVTSTLIGIGMEKSSIVCEYATGQSLEVVLSHGPLSALEAGNQLHTKVHRLARFPGHGTLLPLP